MRRCETLPYYPWDYYMPSMSFASHTTSRSIPTMMHSFSQCSQLRHVLWLLLSDRQFTKSILKSLASPRT